MLHVVAATAHCCMCFLGCRRCLMFCWMRTSWMMHVSIWRNTWSPIGEQLTHLPWHSHHHTPFTEVCSLQDLSPATTLCLHKWHIHIAWNATPAPLLRKNTPMAQTLKGTRTTAGHTMVEVALTMTRTHMSMRVAREDHMIGMGVVIMNMQTQGTSMAPHETPSIHLYARAV